MATAPAPCTIPHGRIAATFASHRIDATQDPPARIPQTGRVWLQATAREVRWPGLAEPLISGQEEIECPIIGGKLYPPGTAADALPAEPGVCWAASEQPGAEPGHVQMRARIELDGCTRRLPDKHFTVPAGGTVDLATVVSITPTPSVIPVVSSEDRIRAEAAAATAEQAATTATEATASAAEHDRSARDAATSASESEQAAAGHAQDARDSATSAAHDRATATTAADTATGAADTATRCAVTATAAAETATGAEQSARESAASAAGSRDVASQAATTATGAAAAAAEHRQAAATSAGDAAESARIATEQAQSVRGFSVTLVPDADWPPAPDPDPLRWYVRVPEVP